MIINFKKTHSKNFGFSLVEVLITLSISSILFIAVISFVMFASKSLTSILNYGDMNVKTRIAIDTISSDVRQCNSVLSSTTNKLKLENNDGLPIIYHWDNNTKFLTRSYKGSVKVLLRKCDEFNFWFNQKNSLSDEVDIQTSSLQSVKIISFSWKCSRSIVGVKLNTSEFQSARIVIRERHNGVFGN